MKRQRKSLFVRLLEVKYDSIFVDAIKGAIEKGRRFGALKMILDQVKDNRPLVAEMLGENLLNEVERFCKVISDSYKISDV